RQHQPGKALCHHAHDLFGQENAAPRHERSSGCLSQRLAGDAQAWSGNGLRIARAMDRLPVLERQATVLVRMIGLSHEDAANICDCDIATIEGRMQRARTRLAALPV
ncbi:sigma factor-like helix-turn-helix DNA-binding protein, partial [Mesorhizobium sp. M7A.F.Ca.US.007.01.1.1]|uniref:sigma factor-like helix-turn-helix DNA-binding protein n=1 Tax=Mesorhizobium sp. M7A.F.Ca.US.007.01.1.1 TaxID=2496712 RepID=UPI000FD193BC